MTRSTPPPWPPSSQGYPPPLFNGSNFEIGLLLGEMRNEGRRQTEILLAMLDEQRELPDRLAERLPASAGAAPPATPTAPAAAAAPPPAPPPTVSQWADLLRALWPLALILAVFLGKLSAPEALPIIRHALGISIPLEAASSPGLPASPPVSPAAPLPDTFR
jgi:hypothetical protein